METYAIDLLAVQETECLHQPIDQIITSNTGKQYRFRHTGVRKGVGFLISPSLSSANVTLRTITSRILHLALSLGQKKQVSFLSVYSPIDSAPTSDVSHNNTAFYSHLQEYIEEKIRPSANHNLIVLGDFNCTLRRRHHSPPLIGQFALQPNNITEDKQKVNADLLTEMCSLLNLRIVNTLVKKSLRKMVTFQPPQKIVTFYPSERIFVKDLILTTC